MNMQKATPHSKVIPSQAEAEAEAEVEAEAEAVHHKILVLFYVNKIFDFDL
jgi:hypothetical protein